MKMRRDILMTVLLAAAAPHSVYSQTAAPNEFKPLTAALSGVHLYGVSVFAGYYSGAPLLFQSAAPSVSGPLPSDLAMGVNASFGWNKLMERSTFAVTYSPSAFKSFRDSRLDTLNHSFSLNWHKKLTGKWAYTLSSTGIVTNLQQLLFVPTTLAAAASLPATFDDFATGLLTGQFTNSQLASILTGTPAAAAPVQTSLYGQRVLSTSLYTGLSYAATGRSSIQFSAAGSRLQNLTGPGSSDGSSAAGRSLVPQITGVGVTLGWSYSLSPRTQIGVSGGTTHTLSRIQTGYATSLNFTVGRTMSRRWLLEAQGGMGFLTYTHLLVTAPRNTHYLVGGSIGFKTLAHTFVVAGNKTLADGYGLGSGSTLATAAAWNWRPRGSAWSLFSGFQYQHLSSSLLVNPGSWRTNAGLARTLRSNMFLNLQYGYAKFPVIAALAGRDFTPAGRDSIQTGLTLSLSWSPSTYR